MLDVTTVVVAIISSIAVVISGIISAVVANSLIKYRLEALEKKVDEHNGYAKKFSECSTDIKLIQQEITYIKERIA